MSNIIHINKTDGKKMVQMYHKGVPYFKDRSKVVSSLPEGYTQLEYIESTGTQWIDTGINVFNTWIIDVETNYKKSVEIIFSRAYGDGGTWFGIANNRYAIGPQFDNVANYRGVFIINFDFTHIEVNDGNKTIRQPSNYTDIHNIYLFAANDGSYSSNTKMYSVKCIENNKDICNCIPCINPSGEIGMYDNINNRFLGNSGTGEFIAGPEVPVETEENNTGIVGLYSRGEVVRDGAEPKYEQWMIDAANEYNIPINNIKTAYTMLPEMQWCFKDGKKCFLVSTEGSGVDTGFIPTVNTKMEFDFILQDVSNNHFSLAQVDHGPGNMAYGLVIWDGNPVYNYGNMFQNRSFKIITNVYYTFVQDKINVYLNDSNGTSNNYKFTTTPDYIGGYTMCLFGLNRNGVKTYNIIGKTSHMRLYENDVIQRFLVPSKKDDKYCMFDLVEGKFYPNDGNGDFTLEIIDD